VLTKLSQVMESQVWSSEDKPGHVRSSSDHGRSGEVRRGQVMVRPNQVRSDNVKVWSGQDRSRQLGEIRSGQVRSCQVK